MAKRKEEPVYWDKKPPHETAHDLVESKAMTRQITKIYNKGDAISQNSAYINNYLLRQDLCETEKLLQEKSIANAQMRVSIEKQWEELKNKEDSFREMFIHFNSFIVGNESKRDRAEDMLLKEREKYRSRTERANELRMSCGAIEDTMLKMKAKIKSYRMYEDFLENVTIRYPEWFLTSHCVMNRYEVIKRAEMELMKHLKNTLQYLEESKKEFTKKVNEYIVVIADLRLKVSLLQQRYDAVKRNTMKWEQLCDRLRSESMEKLTQVVMVKEAISRMYREICDRRGVKPVLDGDYEGQLGVIKKALLDYGRMIEMARAAEREREYASVRPCHSKDTA